MRSCNRFPGFSCATETIQASGLDEVFALSPLVFLEQDATELSQCVRPGIVERPEDPIPVIDGERDDFGLQPERLLEKRAGRLVDDPYELADVLVGDPQAGEIHKGVGTP